MKAVLDTNVLVSGTFWNGAPARVLQAWTSHRFQLVVSVEIVEEYRAVLAEVGARIPNFDADPIITAITTHAELVSAPTLAEQVCSDPDDDKFLAAAIAGAASFVITGDKALLRTSGFGGLQVVRPNVFLTALGARR
jgi:putative PIN family toxin of toxin-antitoxin system